LIKHTNSKTYKPETSTAIGNYWCYRKKKENNIYKDAEAKEQRNQPNKPEAAEPCNVSNSTFSYNEKGTFQWYGSEKDTWIHDICHMKPAFLLLYAYGPRPA
jgi:hypothetical protein